MNSTDNPATALTDPRYIGPGVWYNIHLKAYEAVDEGKIEEFMDQMYLLAHKFPCKKCRTHINAYIESHSFDDLRQLKNKDGRKIGMFKWAWLFHNAVNTRLHKSIIDWETAWNMYDVEIEVCSKNCEGEDHSNDKQSTIDTFVGSTVNTSTNPLSNPSTNPSINPTGNQSINQQFNQQNKIQNKATSKSSDYIEDLPSDPNERKSKLVQGYFMKIGIPSTLRNNGIYDEGVDGMVSFRPLRQIE
jgi:hypothetical protein